MEKEQKLGLIFDSLADELNITETMLVKAKTAYTALGKHIQDSNDKWDVKIYPQGSFELGTVVKPLNEDEQYDVDLVILVREPEYSAEKLRENIRNLIESHGRYVGKIEEKKPCIRIRYANSAQFHMDIASAKTCNYKDDDSIEISKYNGTKYYYDISNPKGYVDWFKQAMKFEQIISERREIFDKIETDVEKLSLTKVRTPLQKAIQILKRHRDIYFFDKENSDKRPSSIIITTLCGLTYDNTFPYLSDKENVYLTICNMINNFYYHIKSNEYGEYFLLNPSNNEENFLKKWKEDNSLKQAFDEWMIQAKIDILANPAEFIEDNLIEFRTGLLKSFGQNIGESTLNRYGLKMGEIAKENNFKFNTKEAIITTNNSGVEYKKHTFFGGC